MFSLFNRFNWNLRTPLLNCASANVLITFVEVHRNLKSTATFVITRCKQVCKKLTEIELVNKFKIKLALVAKLCRINNSPGKQNLEQYFFIRNSKRALVSICCVIIIFLLITVSEQLLKFSLYNTTQTLEKTYTVPLIGYAKCSWEKRSMFSPAPDGSDLP